MFYIFFEFFLAHACLSIASKLRTPSITPKRKFASIDQVREKLYLLRIKRKLTIQLGELGFSKTFVHSCQDEHKLSIPQHMLLEAPINKRHRLTYSCPPFDNVPISNTTNASKCNKFIFPTLILQIFGILLGPCPLKHYIKLRTLVMRSKKSIAGKLMIGAREESYLLRLSR